MQHTEIPEQEGGAAVPPGGPVDLDPAPEDAGKPASLLDDIDALVSDTKTYFEAELTYQKSRAGFVANRGKWVVIYGAAAFGLIHLALIALTVGAVIALAPLVGPWLATGGVVLILIILTILCGLALRAKFSDIGAAFEADDTA